MTQPQVMFRTGDVELDSLTGRWEPSYTGFTGCDRCDWSGWLQTACDDVEPCTCPAGGENQRVEDKWQDDMQRAEQRAQRINEAILSGSDDY